MTSTEYAGNITNTPFDTSAESLLELYSGPIVVIHIGSAGHEYRFPKALLCTQVPYFLASFKEGHFKEGDELSTTLEEIDGVVSTRSFEMLVPWVCIKRIIIKDLPPEEAISLLIEFARLADYLQVTGMESLILEHIKQIISSNNVVEDDNGWALPDNHIPPNI